VSPMPANTTLNGSPPQVACASTLVMSPPCLRALPTGEPTLWA
jgi:hypothetical protein